MTPPGPGGPAQAPHPAFGPPQAIRRWPLALALLLALLVTAAIFARITIRSDLAELLPEGQTQASRLMLAQLREGPASRLLLIGLEGAPESALASVSAALGETLAHDPLFAFVDNGRATPSDAAMDVLFRYRYLLTQAPKDAFSEAALHQDFVRLFQALQSSASPLVQRYGLADPTGAFTQMLQSLAGGAKLRSVDGIWFAQNHTPPRALLIAQTRTGGLDFTAGTATLARLDEAFRAARNATPGAATARMLVSGPSIFAHDASATIKNDVRLVSLLSAIAIACLLVWRFRSPWVVATIAIPLALSAAAGALAVQLVHGFVHGVTLGFGMTMLGIAVDYPVLLIGHRKHGESEAGTLRRIGPTFAMAVMTAALGLTGMVFARFPGVSQLGLFAVSGLLTAAAITRFLLPPLIVAAHLAPVSAGDPRLLHRIEPLRRVRAPVFALVCAAAIFTLQQGARHWDPDLSHLSPVPQAAMALDASLRAELGAPESGQMALITGTTPEAVLLKEEALQPRLDALVKSGAMDGMEDTAVLLPSLATQRARQTALPDPEQLQPVVQQAAAGLGFTGTAFAPFLRDIAAAHSMPPLSPSALDPALAQDPLIGARLSALLLRAGGQWAGLIVPRALHEPARFAAAFANVPGATYADVHAETNAIAAGYTRQALPFLLGGLAAAILALAAALRSLNRLLRVTASIAAALVLTLAALELSGAPIRLMHLIALQFVAGIGLDYALFFSRVRLDEEERSRTLRTLFTCNAMALLSFGALCLCRTPLLRDVGETVALGVAAAMLCGFMFAGPLTPVSSREKKKGLLF